MRMLLGLLMACLWVCGRVAWPWLLPVFLLPLLLLPASVAALPDLFGLLPLLLLLLLLPSLSPSASSSPWLLASLAGLSLQWRGYSWLLPLFATALLPPLFLLLHPSAAVSPHPSHAVLGCGLSPLLGGSSPSATARRTPCSECTPPGLVLQMPAAPGRSSQDHMAFFLHLLAVLLSASAERSA